MRRTKEEAAITREQLLKKALAVFSKKGYAATTLEDIAREANVTRGAIYHHFGGKAELYNTLIREYADRGSQIMGQAVSEGGTLLDILRRVFVRQLQVIEDDREMRALMELYLFKTGLVPELEEGRQQQIESGAGLIEMLAGILSQGMEQGLLRLDVDAKELARSYLAFQNGLIQLWLTTPEQFSLKASAESFADILMAGIQAQK
jgi:TetR/AcrR family transcriptional regulator, acrAB operon repressor